MLSVETYAKHLSPKTQRTYRENRRGMLMKRRQKIPPKRPSTVSMQQDISVQNQSKSQGAKRLSSSDGKSEGPESKRSKITWP